jgi:hypothetical protein
MLTVSESEVKRAFTSLHTLVHARKIGQRWRDNAMLHKLERDGVAHK